MKIKMNILQTMVLFRDQIFLFIQLLLVIKFENERAEKIKLREI